MRFEVKIDCENDAFENDEWGEVARILIGLAKRIRIESRERFVLFDSNGNRVGEGRFADR